jgi:hypothetical protein
MASAPSRMANENNGHKRSSGAGDSKLGVMLIELKDTNRANS